MLIEHYPNGTVGSFRNDLARKAQGEWLCFLDGDDELGPNYIAGMRRACARGPKLEGSPLLLTPVVSKVINGRRRTPGFYPPVDLLGGNYLVIGTLIERRWFELVGGFGDFPHGFEDWSLWYKCARFGARVLMVKHSVYYEHVNPESKHRKAWRDRTTQMQVYEQVKRELEAWMP